jgi:hypothetical protein
MSVAFIIPIHPKDYHYIYDLLELISVNIYCKIDIYLVFSNECDYENFNRKNEIKKIIIPQNIDTKNIVTYKKYFALEKLKDDINYDYFIVCDAEISIIPENFNEKNILNKINKIYENKIIYAGKIINSHYKCDDIIKNITKDCCDLINGGNILEQNTENYTLYFWWSDLPMYKREHLTHFFSIIKYDNIVFNHYDHIIYLCYLMLHHNFNIVNITPIVNYHWSLEMYNTTNIDDLNKLKSINYGFSYIYKKLYYNHIDFFKNEGCFVIYHLDRNI